MAVKTKSLQAWSLESTGCRSLYGDFSRTGFSVELHEFATEKPLDWGSSFHDDSIELCLNLSGQGAVQGSDRTAHYENRTAGFYFTGQKGLTASREAVGPHAFITLEWSRGYLSNQLKGYEDHVPGELRQWLSRKAARGDVSQVQPMAGPLETLYTGLRQPPVATAALPLWYQSKALELLALMVFEKNAPEEMFCHRQQRVARDRVERTVKVIQQHLTEPPDLEALGAHVGCSPFYLSRLFSREMKMTIPQYIREQRMQRAAELLRSGKFNVTEAAMEVGYNSLSHFSKAFWDAFGCCPGLYPQGAKLFPRSARSG